MISTLISPCLIAPHAIAGVTVTVGEPVPTELAGLESVSLPSGVSGTDVENIKGVETLSDWTTLTSKHLTLQVNNSQRYLLTLQDSCQQLRGARRVAVSMTNQEIWADFDYVAADGHECRINQITRLSLDQE